MMQPGLQWCKTPGCNRACRLGESLRMGYCEGCRLLGRMPEPQQEKQVVEFAIGDKAREIATGYVVEIIDVEAETTPTKVVGYQVRFKDKSEKWVRPDELYPEKVNLPEPKAGHPEFYAILDEMKAVHERKAADYGSDEDPLHNVRSGGEFANIPAWVAAMLRANDKMVRLKSLIKKGKLENESAEDSLMDIANYAILALILKREGGR